MSRDRARAAANARWTLAERRKLEHKAALADALLATLKVGAGCLLPSESLHRPPAFYETAYSVLVRDARAAVDRAKAAGVVLS